LHRVPMMGSLFYGRYGCGNIALQLIVRVEISSCDVFFMARLYLEFLLRFLQHDFPLLMDAKEWINIECAACMFPLVNIRDCFTHSHPSKGENHIRKTRLNSCMFCRMDGENVKSEWRWSQVFSSRERSSTCTVNQIYLDSILYNSGWWLIFALFWVTRAVFTCFHLPNWCHITFGIYCFFNFN
jgi:hypothetical protein